MTVTARALYIYTGVSVNVSDKQARTLYPYSNIAANPDDKQARTLYPFTNVVRLTDPDDGVEVQLLDTSLEVERILRGR